MSIVLSIAPSTAFGIAGQRICIVIAEVTRKMREEHLKRFFSSSPGSSDAREALHPPMFTGQAICWECAWPVSHLQCSADLFQSYSWLSFQMCVTKASIWIGNKYQHILLSSALPSPLHLHLLDLKPIWGPVSLSHPPCQPTVSASQHNLHNTPSVPSPRYKQWMPLDTKPHK